MKLYPLYSNQVLLTSSSPTFAGITIADGGTIGQAAGPLLTFDDSNNYLEITGCDVGIGIATPDGTLHVHTATCGSCNPNNTDLVVESNGNCGIAILSPDANTTGLTFGSPADDNSIEMLWVRSSSAFYISTSGGAYDIVVRTGDAVELLKLANTGRVGIMCSSPAGTLSIGNVTEGRTASLNVKTAHETHTLTLGASSVTTGLDIPTTALVLGAAFCVNTAVTDDGGNDTWSAAFSGGDASAIVAAVAAAQNTKAHSTVVPALTNAETEITFTPQGGNFSAGIIEVVAYYIDLTDLANV